MKTIGTLISIALLSAPAFGQINAPSAGDWQKIVIGTDLKVDCPSKKIDRELDGGRYNALDINIKIKNNQSLPITYNLDIFFLDQSFKNHEIRQRDKKSVQISLVSGTSTNLNFHASVMNGKDEISVAWSGYIVRLSAYDKPVKTVASSKALEKLAADPEKMRMLEAGKIVAEK